jgi:hypothetical protein
MHHAPMGKGDFPAGRDFSFLTVQFSGGGRADHPGVKPQCPDLVSEVLEPDDCGRLAFFPEEIETAAIVYDI